MSNLQKHEYSMQQCNHCGQCKWILPAKMHGWDFAEVCPIFEYFGFDGYSGQGLINIAHEILQGRLSHSDGLAKMLYSCTACGVCDINCKNVRDMELLETIYELRASCVEAGYLPQSLQEQGRNIENTHNIYGISHDERFSWLPEDFSDDPDSDTALFVGCSVYKDPSTALAAIRILKAGGVKFKLLMEDEWCCGVSLWRTGQFEAAQNLVKRNVETFANLGVKKIITSCAECFGSFRAGYPRFAKVDFETVHISQVVCDLIEQGKLQFKNDEGTINVTYHDPCMLGRLSEQFVDWEGEILSYGRHVPRKQWRRGEHGVYEEPRKVIKSIPGLQLVEMIRNNEDSWCCGAHAKTIDSKFSEHVADDRLREARAIGVKAIISSCPFCKEALGEDSSSEPIEYCDLTELVASRLVEEG